MVKYLTIKNTNSKKSVYKIQTKRRISSCNKLSKNKCLKNKKCKLTKKTSKRKSLCRPRKNKKIRTFKYARF